MYGTATFIQLEILKNCRLGIWKSKHTRCLMDLVSRDYITFSKYIKRRRVYPGHLSSHGKLNQNLQGLQLTTKR